MTIGQLVKKHCDDNKITRWEFAEKVGMSDFAVGKLIRENKLPAIPYIKNIATALDMSFMDLIHEHYSTLENEIG